MVDVAETPKKAKTPKVKKPKTVPTHPKVSDMVNAAIASLKERGGSSLQAIKKYIKANYKVDAEKLSPFLKKYLKSAVASGSLVQIKGKGATGSFRIGSSVKEKKVAAKPKKAAVKAAPKPKKPKATTSKKAAKPKKAAAKPKKTPTKKTKPATPKKVAKPKTVKAKTPKAKKPKATPKKAAAKKGKK